LFSKNFQNKTLNPTSGHRSVDRVDQYNTRFIILQLAFYSINPHIYYSTLQNNKLLTIRLPD